MAGLFLIATASQTIVPQVAAQGIPDSEARHLAELEEMAGERVKALPPCEQAFFYFWHRFNNPIFANAREISDDEFKWALAMEETRGTDQQCPQMPPAVVNGLLAEATLDPSGTLAGQSKISGRASEQAGAAERDRETRRQVAAMPECERAYAYFVDSTNGQFSSLSRKFSAAEHAWAQRYAATRRTGQKCPPMPPEVVNGLLADTERHAAGTILGQKRLAEADRKADQAAAQVAAAEQANRQRVAAIPPCERAYLFFFYRMNNPLYADKRRMTDDEIGWALDYERARRTGQPCPPMSAEVTNGILAEASMDAKGTLIGQSNIGALDQQRQALVDYDRRASQVLTAAENCWANGRAEAFRKSNPAGSMFSAWQRCAQVVANAEALTGQRKIVWPSISDFNAMSNFVANSLRNKWAEQDASLARAQQAGDRGPVWGPTRDAELERRNNILSALQNNERYLSYIDSFDYRGNATRYAPREARSQYPWRPSSYPPFQRR